MGLLGGSHFVKTEFRSEPFDTNYGKIVGKKFLISNNRYVDAFMGIPFAKSPVGDLRFKKPEPPEKWEGIRHCIQHGPRGPQKGLALERLGPMVRTSEDCLYLNVFAPEWDVPDDQPNGRAVLVFIHGGGFAVHSSANYGDYNICNNICLKEVIVVTIQYRLGILGFCATGDENAIPNLGLWDQAMALTWVKNNIAYFKGDPENLTVFGQSAGGASVDMLCLSPHTNGLFSKAIPMGGSASCGWAITSTEEVRKATMKVAQKLGWKQPEKGTLKDVNKSLMDFLKKQSSSKLSLSLVDAKRTSSNPYGLYFVPVIDGDFLPEPIPELRKKAPKKLCMTGTTEYEALLFVALARKYYGIKQLKKLIPRTFTESNFSDHEELRRKALSIYIHKGQTKKEESRAYVKLLSDVLITNGVHDFANDMTLAGHTVYLYSFLYSNPETFGLFGLLFPFKSATHALELPYLFDKGLINTFKPNAEDKKVMHRFTSLVTNFAVYGDPNGKNSDKLWLPLTIDDTYKYLSIDKECSMQSNFENRRSEFWREVKAKRLSKIAL